MGIDISELEDYPPRLVIKVSPTDKASAPAKVTMQVTGLKQERTITIANESKLAIPTNLY